MMCCTVGSWLVFTNRKPVIKAAIIYVTFKLVNLFTTSTAEQVAVNAIAMQYVRRVDPSS